MTDPNKAQQRAPTSTPRIRARVDPSLLASSSGSISGSAKDTPTPSNTKPALNSAGSRPRLRSNVSSTSSRSGVSGVSATSADASGYGYGRPRSPIRAASALGYARDGRGSGTGAVSPSPVFAGAARARLTPSRAGEASALGVGGSTSTSAVEMASGSGSATGSASGVISSGSRDGAQPVEGGRIKARVTTSGPSTPRIGASAGSGTMAPGTAVAGPSRPVPLSSVSSPAIASISSSGPAHGASSTGGRASPVPGRARVRATPISTPTSASIGDPKASARRAQSPLPDLRTSSTSASIVPQTPTDARVRAIITASPSIPAVSSPLSPHPGSASLKAPASTPGTSAISGPSGTLGMSGGPGTADPHTPLRSSDPSHPSNHPPRPLLAIPLTPTLSQPSHSPAAASFALTSGPDKAYLMQDFNSLSAPTSPMLDASRQGVLDPASRPESGSGTAAGETMYNFQRQYSQTPTLARQRPHPLRHVPGSAPRTGPGQNGPNGFRGVRGMNGIATPQSPEMHTIALPPLTPSTCRPLMDGIQTPRYPHLDRGRNGSTGHPGGEDGVVGVLRGWGGGEGDDGGLGLGIIQGLQGLGRDGDGDGHADGGHEAEEVHAVGMTNGGRERDPRDRLSGSTIVNDDSAYEGPGKAGYTNGAAARDGAPEDVEESDSRADESMRDSPDGDEVRSDEEEEDVVEARINRKVADLEISNASLMAINRSLESTKAKQRAEILRLRRQLRESLHLPPSFSGRPLLSPTLPLGTGAGAGDKDKDILDLEAEDDSDASDIELEIESRWAAMEELVRGMTTKAAEAVERTKEEVKPVGRMVLPMVLPMGMGTSGGAAEGEGDLGASVISTQGDDGEGSGFGTPIKGERD